MDEQFDKKLTNHIRGVFEDYEHPGDADAGWAELRKKFPAQSGRNKAAWLWWGSAAAILLITLGIGLWAINKDDTATNYANNQPVKTQLKDTATTANNMAANALPGNAANADNTKTDNLNTDNNKPQLAQQPTTDPFAANKYINNLAGQQIAPVVKYTQPTEVVKQQVPAVTNNAPDKSALIASSRPDKPVVDSAKAPGNQISNTQIAQVDIPVAEKPTVATSIAKQQRPKSIIELMEAEKGTGPTRKEVKTDRDKKVNFSVYAATYFNYAEGSANQINAGAGFTSDIKLSRNIKLSTGMALAQNTLRYNNSIPPSDRGSAQAFAAAASPTIKQSDLFNVSAEVPVFRNYNASLIGLDVPINIKYEFNPDKSDTYVSAGLSSGTFIDEKYTYSYTYSNNRTATPQNATTTNSFNSFYFGKTLNVSFGVGYPLGKSNRLIIEPFLKYPLDGLGAQQLRFGAGGLNLKINFKGRK